MYIFSFIKSKCGSGEISRKGYLERIVAHMNRLTNDNAISLRVITNHGNIASASKKTYVAMFVSARLGNPELKEMKPVDVPIDLKSWEGLNDSLCTLADEFTKKAIITGAIPSYSFRFNQLAILLMGQESYRQYRHYEMKEAAP